MKPQPIPPLPTPPEKPEKLESPQVPDHKPKTNFLAQNESFDDDDEDPICGPAETITGETR